MGAKGVGAVLRLSPHYYNTDDELAAAVAAIGEEMKSLSPVRR